MEIEFQSEQELYVRLLPALRTKKKEMKRNGYPYIKEEDIWNYLKESKWKKGKDLSLFDLVNDILNVDDAYVDLYMKQKLNSRNRHLYFEEEGAL